MSEPAIEPRWRRTALAASCVPWDDHDEPIEGLFREAIRRLALGGLRDQCVFATAGESSALSGPLFRRTTAIFLDEAAGAGISPVVGVSGLSVAEARNRIEWAAGEGVRTFLIGPTAPHGLNDLELRGFFDAICGGHPELEFIHDNPGGAGRLVRPDQYADIADRHANLVGTRYPGGDTGYIAGLAEYAPELRHYFSELGFYAGAALGGCGLAVTVAASNPARALSYLTAAERGDHAELTTMYRELAGITVVLRAAVGPGAQAECAAGKTIAKVSDPRFPLRLLTPYEPPQPSGWKWYTTALHTRWPRWLPEDLEESL
jgi:dihydrodipicolinate synthase/N-acetylneuraminate lyase